MSEQVRRFGVCAGSGQCQGSKTQNYYDSEPDHSLNSRVHVTMPSELPGTGARWNRCYFPMLLQVAGVSSVFYGASIGSFSPPIRICAMAKTTNPSFLAANSMSLPDVPCLTNSRHKYSIHCFHPPPSDQAALLLYIPPCHQTPHHRLHLPSSDQPLRIQVEGPLIALQKLLPRVSWYTANHSPPFPLPGGPELAKLAFKTMYRREVQPDVPGDTVVRNESTCWLREARPAVYVIVTFSSSRACLH